MFYEITIDVSGASELEAEDIFDKIDEFVYNMNLPYPISTLTMLVSREETEDA